MNSLKSRRRLNEDEGDENYYHNLCNYSIEKCELCDMVFSSRFANIIHNSNHIIIPLLKQNIYTCKICLSCFTSESELKNHKENKHTKKKHDEVNTSTETENKSGRSNDSFKTQPTSKTDLKNHKEKKHDKVNKSTETGNKSGRSNDSFKTQPTSKSDLKNHKEKKHDKVNKSTEKGNKSGRSNDSFQTQPTSKSELKNHKEKKHDKVNKSTEKGNKSGRSNDSFQTQPTSKSELKNHKEKKHDKVNKSTEKGNKSGRSNDSFQTQSTSKSELKNHKEKKHNKVNKSTEKGNKSEIIDDTVQSQPIIEINQIRTYINKTKFGSKPNKNTNISDSNVIFGYKTTSTDTSVKQKEVEISFKRETSPISIKSDSSDTPDFYSKQLEEVLRSPTINGELKIKIEDDDEDLPIPSQHYKIQEPLKTPDNSINEISELEILKREFKKLNSPIRLVNLSTIKFEEEDMNMTLLDEELKNLSYELQSVHHDELCEAMLSECRRCHKIFGNRMNLYKHEKVHMKIKLLSRNQYYSCNICKKYYSGNHWSKKKHFKTYHPEAKMTNRPFNICKICNANLELTDVKMHYKLQHPHLYCDPCKKTFLTELAVTSHSCPKMSKVTGTKKPAVELLKVCELCFSFTKNTQNFKYEIVGEKCELGKRQKCVYCQKDYFDVKLVRRFNLMERKAIKKKHENSNEARLAKLQKRFKAINKF